jgi:hypothetical protein
MNPATLASPQLTVANRRDGSVSGSDAALRKFTVLGQQETHVLRRKRIKKDRHAAVTPESDQTLIVSRLR